MTKEESLKWLATPSWEARVSADNLRNNIWRSIVDDGCVKPPLQTTIPVSNAPCNGMTATEVREQKLAEAKQAAVKAEYERFMQHLDEMEKRQAAAAGGPFGDPYGLGAIGGTTTTSPNIRTTSTTGTMTVPLPPGGMAAPGSPYNHPLGDDWETASAPAIEKPVKRIDETTFDDYKRGVENWWASRPRAW